MNAAIPKAHLGAVVKFNDGKYKGFEGLLMKTCDVFASIFIRVDDVGAEVVEEIKYLTRIAEIPSLPVRQPNP